MTPTPTLPLSGGGRRKQRQDRDPAPARESAPTLTLQGREKEGARGRGLNDAAAEKEEAPRTLSELVRELYETSIVPVAEIARLVGVSERTLYKHVQRGGWRRRHFFIDNAGAPLPSDKARALLARRAARRPHHIHRQPRGAGGRLIHSSQADRPQASGLLALDPAAADAAKERCALALDVSRAIFAQAAREAADLARTDDARRRSESDARILRHVTRALRDLNAMLRMEETREAEEQQAAQAQGEKTEALRAVLAKRILTLVAEEAECSPLVPAKAGTQGL